ncbi:5-bromo-4-chloroindolyl phosphate hydrolysis family protein [Paracoccaceae bacterium GXU_MW_L88]
MAERWGGRYSPENSRPEDWQLDADGRPPAANFRGRKVRKSRFRARAMFALPIPLLFSALGAISGGDPMETLGRLGGFALLMLAAWINVDGLKAEDAYNERKIARRPAFPRKIFASVLTGLGVGLGATLGFGTDIIGGVVFGLLAGVSHSLAFGLDPLKDKGLDETNRFDADRAMRAVEDAEKMLNETLAASRRFNDRRLEERVRAMATAAREMFARVEEDPRDLTRARKYLTVYLQGARDATLKFADLYARNPETESRAEYVELLDDLEQSFRQKRDILLVEDRTDLDVEIEVLRDRLQQEGLVARKGE